MLILFLEQVPLRMRNTFSFTNKNVREFARKRGKLFGKAMVAKSTQVGEKKRLLSSQRDENRIKVFRVEEWNMDKWRKQMMRTILQAGPPKEGSIVGLIVEYIKQTTEGMREDEKVSFRFSRNEIVELGKGLEKYRDIKWNSVSRTLSACGRGGYIECVEEGRGRKKASVYSVKEWDFKKWLLRNKMYNRKHYGRYYERDDDFIPVDSTEKAGKGQALKGKELVDLKVSRKPPAHPTPKEKGKEVAKRRKGWKKKRVRRRIETGKARPARFYYHEEENEEFVPVTTSFEERKRRIERRENTRLRKGNDVEMEKEEDGGGDEYYPSTSPTSEEEDEIVPSRRKRIMKRVRIMEIEDSPPKKRRKV